MDWPRILAVCQDRGVTLQMAAALNYLRENFEQPVPPEIPRQLEEVRTSLPSRTLAQVLMSPDLSRRFWQKIRYHWAVYSKGIEPSGPFRWIGNVPRYLVWRYQTRRLWTIPFRLLADIWRVACKTSRPERLQSPHDETVSPRETLDG
jgi:hypothetical protein